MAVGNGVLSLARALPCHTRARPARMATLTVPCRTQNTTLLLLQYVRGVLLVLEKVGEAASPPARPAQATSYDDTVARIVAHAGLRTVGVQVLSKTKAEGGGKVFLL